METLIHSVPVITAVFLLLFSQFITVTKDSYYLVGVLIFKTIPFTLAVLNLIVAGKVNNWW